MNDCDQVVLEICLPVYEGGEFLLVFGRYFGSKDKTGYLSHEKCCNFGFFWLFFCSPTTPTVVLAGTDHAGGAMD